MDIVTNKIQRVIGKSLYAIATKSSEWGRREKAVSFFELDDFPFVKKVLKKKDTLIKETEQLLTKETALPTFQHIAQLPKERRKTAIDKNWKNHVLFLNGKKITENCDLCPEITKLLEEDVPNVGTSLLSILHGNTKIEEHRGEQNGMLRLHIPILVPKNGDCAINVNGETRSWLKEKAMIFDHSFLHSAWNNSDEIRVVLIIDFERDLLFPWSSINRMAVKALSKTPHFKQILERSKFPKTNKKLYN